MKKFDWEDFKKSRIAVCVKTKDEFDSFMQKCEKQGIEWATGDKATEYTPFCVSAKDLCIVGHEGTLAYEYAELVGMFPWFEIVNFSDIDFDEEIQAPEETPKKKPLDLKFSEKLSELQSKFTTDLFELSKEYDISEADLMKKAIGGFEFLAFIKKVVE